MYNFNEEHKRLEPSETLCQYCETEHSTDMEDNYFIPLFREKDRTNVIVYRSVKFSKIPVGIPRCKTCKAVHAKASTIGALVGWSVALIFVIGWFKIFGVSGLFSLIIGPFLAVGLTILITKQI